MSERPIHPTLECFVERDGKYLMLRRAPTKKIMPNVWIAPGGHQEFCEGLFAATRREILEETGIEISNIKLRVMGTAHLRDINREFLFRILTASYAGGTQLETTEDGELAWLTVDEILALDNILSELKPLAPLLFGADDSSVYSVRVVYEGPNEMVEFEVEEP